MIFFMREFIKSPDSRVHVLLYSCTVEPNTRNKIWYPGGVNIKYVVLPSLLLEISKFYDIRNCKDKVIRKLELVASVYFLCAKKRFNYCHSRPSFYTKRTWHMTTFREFRAENFWMVDIGINAWSTIFLNLEIK